MSALLLAALVAMSVPAAAGLVQRAVRHGRLIARLGPAARPAEPDLGARVDRLGARLLALPPIRGIAARIAGAHPWMPPTRAAAGSVVVAAAGAAAGLLTGYPAAAPAGAAAALVASGRLVARYECRRREAVEQQLPDLIALQAAALRAGHSVQSSLVAAGREVGPPLGPELARCSAELDLGAPLEEALRRLAGRCGTAALEPWMAALLAGRTTGGDLTRALTALSGRARARTQLRSELRALTAQGRLSATVVSIAPLVVLVLLLVAAPAEARTLYGPGTARAVLALGAVLDVVGLLWIRRLAGVRP